MELMLLLQNLTTQKSLWANLVCVFSAARIWGSDAKKMSKLPSGTVFRASKFRMCALFYISLLWTTFSDDFAISTRETSISSLGKVIPCISHEIKPFAPWYLTRLFLHLDMPSLENANLTVGNVMNIRVSTLPQSCQCPKLLSASHTVNFSEIVPSRYRSLEIILWCLIQQLL